MPLPRGQQLSTISRFVELTPEGKLQLKEAGLNIDIGGKLGAPLTAVKLNPVDFIRLEILTSFLEKKIDGLLTAPQLDLQKPLEKFWQLHRLQDHLWLNIRPQFLHLAQPKGTADGKTVCGNLTLTFAPQIVMDKKAPVAALSPQIILVNGVNHLPKHSDKLGIELVAGWEELFHLIPQDVKTKALSFGVDLNQMKVTSAKNRGPSVIQIQAPLNGPFQGKLLVWADFNISKNIISLKNPKCEVELDKTQGGVTLVALGYKLGVETAVRGLLKDWNWDVNQQLNDLQNKVNNLKVANGMVNFKIGALHLGEPQFDAEELRVILFVMTPESLKVNLSAQVGETAGSSGPGLLPSPSPSVSGSLVEIGTPVKSTDGHFSVWTTNNSIEIRSESKRCE